MQIRYVRGDFIDGRESVILHGCNAQGRMGRGAAKAVKEGLPWAYAAYRRAYETAHAVESFRCLQNGLKLPNDQAPLLPLGEVVWAIDTANRTSPRIVGNLITQEYYERAKAPNDGINLSYVALTQALERVTEFAYDTQSEVIKIPGITPVRSIGMVKIGAGLAGGDWNLIAPMIESASADVYRPVVYVLE